MLNSFGCSVSRRKSGWMVLSGFRGLVRSAWQQKMVWVGTGPKRVLHLPILENYPNRFIAVTLGAALAPRILVFLLRPWFCIPPYLIMRRTIPVSTLLPFRTTTHILNLLTKNVAPPFNFHYYVFTCVLSSTGLFGQRITFFYVLF